ncbi:hypothetical protein GC163_21850 [bacterium]|nr:hypothetical protein [bacterium]
MIALCFDAAAFLGRMSLWRRLSCLLMVLMAPAWVSAEEAGELRISATQRLGKGSLVVMEKPGLETRHVLLHFHGAHETVAKAFRRSEISAVLVVVNFSGLSEAYAKPFAEDPELLDRILSEAAILAQHDPATPPPTWDRLSLSSFSAGYGAIREILKQPQAFERISAIVTADSIYAGLRQPSEPRAVDERNMQGFLEFAKRAAQGEKTFVLSHSAQPTPYASTTETADYLLQSLSIERVREDQSEPLPDGLRPTSHAQRGHFEVLGFAGETGKDHMQHLYQIDRFWNQIPKLDALPQ